MSDTKEKLCSECIWWYVPEDDNMGECACFVKCREFDQWESAE